MDRQSKYNHVKEELMWYGLNVVRSLGSGGFGEVVLANKGTRLLTQTVNT
jgi:hypothetical protein